MSDNIHAVVQNSYNFYMITFLSVKDEMSSCMIFPVTGFNIIAGHSNVWLVGNCLKTVIYHSKIFIPLEFSPFP